MKPSHTEEQPTADHVDWAQEILRRNGQRTAFPSYQHIDAEDDRRSPPDGGNTDFVVPYHTDDSNAIVGDIGEDPGLSLEEKLQRRMAERDAAFVGVAGSPPPPAPLPSRRIKQEEGEGMKEESPSSQQRPHAAADPVPYSGGGCLYEDADNDCDITHSTTLSYMHFDDGDDDGGAAAVSSS